MDWIDQVEKPDEFIRNLFPVAPSLERLRVLEVTLHEDGPSVSLRCNLNDFPKQPPAKWIKAEANRVQITLSCFGVRRLKIDGWGTNNLVSIRMEKLEGDAFILEAVGDAVCLRAESRRVTLDKVTAYRDRSLTD